MRVTTSVLLLIVYLVLSPAIAVAGVDGYYVNVFAGGFEYLTLTSAGDEESGFIETFRFAPGPGGVQRSRRDVAGTARGGHILLHDVPAWAGGEPLNGDIGWNTITLHFTAQDGTIDQAVFRKSSVAEINGRVAGMSTVRAAASQAVAANADLQAANSTKASALTEIAQRRSAIGQLASRLPQAQSASVQARANLAAASAHEAQEIATEQQMRTQEGSMPNDTQAEHQAYLDYHQQVNDQHGRVNNAHGAYNSAREQSADADRAMLSIENALAYDRQRVVALYNLIAACNARINSDTQQIADAQRRIGAHP